MLMMTEEVNTQKYNRSFSVRNFRYFILTLFILWGCGIRKNGPLILHGSFFILLGTGFSYFRFVSSPFVVYIFFITSSQPASSNRIQKSMIYIYKGLFHLPYQVGDIFQLPSPGSEVLGLAYHIIEVPAGHFFGCWLSFYNPLSFIYYIEMNLVSIT